MIANVLQAHVCGEMRGNVSLAKELWQYAQSVRGRELLMSEGALSYLVHLAPTGSWIDLVYVRSLLSHCAVTLQSLCSHCDCAAAGCDCDCVGGVITVRPPTQSLCLGVISHCASHVYSCRQSARKLIIKRAQATQGNTREMMWGSGALYCLSKDESNLRHISAATSLDALLHVASSGNDKAREWATGALYNASRCAEYRAPITRQVAIHRFAT